MRDLVMIKIEDYEIFKKNLSTLKETSIDKNASIYMTESNLNVVNFDDVKNDYVADMHLKEVPKSNDAFYIDEDDLVFIEFKNGNMEKKKYDVRLKIFDSLLIFSDIVKVTSSFTREHLKYILVYNEIINPEPTDSNAAVQTSPSRTLIAKTFIEKKAKEKFIRFNLERFEKLYFREVYTYTEKEFDENFIQKKCTA